MMAGVHQWSVEVHAVQTASLYFDSSGLHYWFAHSYSVTVAFEVAVFAFE